MPIVHSLRVTYATQTRCGGACRQLNYKRYSALSIIESARHKDPWPKNWLNVENLILFDQSILVYKILSKLCPESFWNVFQHRSSLSNYNTRNYKYILKDVHISMAKLESTKKGFQYPGIKAWNNIQINIQNNCHR